MSAVVKRPGAKLEARGMLIIVASMVVGAIGFVTESACLITFIAGVGFAVGLVVFIVGRFK